MKLFDYELPLDYEALSLGGGHKAFMTCYLPTDHREYSEGRRRPAVIVIPGGGYRYCSAREAEPVALQYTAQDMASFVLIYSTGDDAGYPRCLFEALSAVKTIREHAEEWEINPDQISLIGFSAGGHLAASCGAFWHTDFVKRAFGDNESVRPNAILLSYPVISTGHLAHAGSVKNLLGENPDPTLLGLNSLEKQVTEFFPPTFLWHTATDKTVPVANSIVMAASLAEKGILFELHIYPTGPHGLALSDERTAKIDENGNLMQRLLEKRPRAWMGESIRFLKETVFKTVQS